MSSLRDRARHLSYAVGPLGLYHMLFNRSRLTVVRIHRNLPESAPERSAADAEYTLDAGIFDECLGFFARHYSPVSLAQVVDAATGGAPLPSWPLLITFDDGWADTLSHAAPLLAKRKMPAACFVVSNVLDDPTERWWQDSFGHAWRAKRTQLENLKATWTAPGVLPAPATAALSNPYLMGLAMMSDLAPEERTALLDKWLSGLPHHAPRQMLTAADVPALPHFGISVGAHGTSHIPLTLSRSPAAELAGARVRLTEVLASSEQKEVTTLSFPHGRFDADIIAKARDCGYKMMFTSAAHLNELSAGRPPGDILGRIEVATRHVAPDGQFRPDLLACQVFLRPALKTTAEIIAAGIAAPT